jgi:formiminotetrahydrofolate cyclodeaminase
MNEPPLLKFLELPTMQLLEAFGAGRHKPGSGSAAALLGLLSCRMLQTVICVTKRNLRYAAVFGRLDYIKSLLLEKDMPFFQEAVQRDSEQFDRYFRARENAKRLATSDTDKARSNELARRELMLATEIPLDIARRSAETTERGLMVYDLGAQYARGDSGVAISAALSAFSGALFIVYLNLAEFREGQWAQSIRAEADILAIRFEFLQTEQFRRVSAIRFQNESFNELTPALLHQTELGLDIPKREQYFDDQDPLGIPF